MTTTDAAVKVAPVELETGASVVCLVRLGGDNMTIRWMMPIAVLVMAAACGSPADVESELTRGEATFLLKGILALRETGGLTLVELSGDGVVASCPLGGRVTFKGSAHSRQVADTVWVDRAETIIPDGCGFTISIFDFRLDGVPDLHKEVAKEIFGRHGKVRAATGSLKGRVLWYFGGRKGDCAMDLTLSHKPHSAATGVYRGNVCGHEGVEYEVSLGVILLSGQLPPAVLG